MLRFTALPASMTYGGPLPGLTNNYSVTGWVNGDTAKRGCGNAAHADHGRQGRQPCRLVCHSYRQRGPEDQYSGLTNYTVTYVANSLTVTPATLTVTADNKWMLHGSTPASLPLTFSYQGLVNSDTPASLTVKPTATTIATSASPAGSYVITPSGGVDSDYVFKYKAGILTVEPTLNAVYLMPDPLPTNSGQYVLYIWGTAGNDSIAINPGGLGSVSVVISGVSKGTFGSGTQPISRIVAHGIAGYDTMTVSASVTLPAWLYLDNGSGGSLSGGGGPTYLFGDPGATLRGGNGRSILIGGLGSQTLMAGAGDAILIGGTTVYNPASPGRYQPRRGPAGRS